MISFSLLDEWEGGTAGRGLTCRRGRYPRPACGATDAAAVR